MISDGVAYTVTRILEQNVDYGTGVGADYGHPAAGKTGTTEEWSDAWFCGYTPRLGTTVWVGYPKAKIPMTSVHGIRGHRRQLPGPDLAAVHELGDRPARAGVDFPEPMDEPEWKDFERGQYARSFGYYDDGSSAPAETTETTETETETETAPTETVPDAPPAGRPAAAAPAAGHDGRAAAAARRRHHRLRRRNRRRRPPSRRHLRRRPTPAR